MDTVDCTLVEGKEGKVRERGGRGREREAGGEVPMTDKEVKDDVKGFQMRSLNSGWTRSW